MHGARFTAIGTRVHPLATNADALDTAHSLARLRLAQLDAAASRFHPDADLAVLNAAADRKGLVDPSIGADLIGADYDRDFALIDDSERERILTPPLARPPRDAWALDDLHQRLRVAIGIVLDVGSSANAASTAAIILGEDALGRLELGGIAARLNRLDSGRTTLTPGWPIAVRQRAA